MVYFHNAFWYFLIEIDVYSEFSILSIYKSFKLRNNDDKMENFVKVFIKLPNKT